MEQFPLSNPSEIGRLKTVMLHRPGLELNNLMPEYLDRLLFDDIPYLEAAQREHDLFAQCLRDNGVEVLYLTDLVAEAISEKGVRNMLVEQYLQEAGLECNRLRDALRSYFEPMSNHQLVETMMAGIRRSSLKTTEKTHLSDFIKIQSEDYPFVADPMPNLYFTRDPFAVIGHGVSIHKMHTETRNRETLFGKFIFTYHPKYKTVKQWYDRGAETSIEGGDILVLSPKVLAVGISERTREDSIDDLAHRVLRESKTFEKVLAVNIPKSRAFMHLDTVFTMVDYDKFTVHPNILHEITVYVCTMEGGELHITEEQGSLENILKKHLELDKVTLIRCGSDDTVDAAREQWSDGSNTLAIAPGEVVVYARNTVTNRALEDNGIKLHVIQCSELSRGRGGPRCMSMPFYRETP